MGWKAFVEGGVASIVAGCSTHPLDLIKVRMQLQGEGGPAAAAAAAAGLPPASSAPSSSLRRQLPPPPPPAAAAVRQRMGPAAMGRYILRAEGIHALFAGVSATLVRQATYSTTRMGLYDVMKSRWERRSRSGGGGGGGGMKQVGLAVEKKVLLGLVAGGIGAAVGSPADMAMVRMQADGRLPAPMRRNYRGVADAIVRTARDEGASALWRGGSLTVLRAMLVTSSQLASYDEVKEEVLRRQLMGDGLPLHVLASSVAGVAASLASNPVDVIKTRLMNDAASSSSSSSSSLPSSSSSSYRGPLDCAVKTIRHEGPLALYKGLLPTMFRQAPFTIILFVTLERMRKLLRHSTDN